jgi:serine/threonine-protein kinase
MTPSSVPSVPTRIGPYRVLARLASGGMGEVVVARRAWTTGFEQAVVIKRVLPHLASDPETNAAFLDEARLMATLRHPNIVGVLAYSRDAGELYLVMELLRGGTLSGLRRELAERREELDPVLAVHIVSELCAGLHAAHELTDEAGNLLHVVHRDVSPANVFVTFDGEIKILDFGIAAFEGRSQSRTQTGVAKGKFPYMAPEQFAGSGTDRRTDIFAAGVVLHELVTGRRLFARESEAKVMNAILTEPIPLPSEVAGGRVRVPEALDAICATALARDPAERFETADAMRRALRELLPALDPRQRAADRLIEIARRVLPDRLAASEHLLRRSSLESGDFAVMLADQAAEILSAPSADVEAGAAGPSALAAVVDPEVLLREEPTRAGPSASDRRASGRRYLLGALLVALIPAALGAGALVGTPRAGAPPVRATHEPPTPWEIASPPKAVVFDIDTAPTGATVVIDGVPRGTGPLHLELVRSETPVEVVLQLAGYATWRGGVVPDTDRRLAPRLVRAEVPRHAPRARPLLQRLDDPEAISIERSREAR